MEPKKSVKADLEWKKPTFLQIGLVVSLLVVYLAFEMVGSQEKSEAMFVGTGQMIDEEQVIQTEQPKELPPPPPQQMSQTIIEVIADNIRVDDFTIDAEADENLEVEEIAYVEDTKEEKVVEAEIFEVVEIEPKFPGGEDARMKFLFDNIVYPKVARETGLEGMVTVGFVVEPDGSITNVEIIRGRAPSLDEEAIRVTKKMPKWTPGKQRGKNVRVRYRMPIRFSLN
jgi:protein TonB